MRYVFSYAVIVFVVASATSAVIADERTRRLEEIVVRCDEAVRQDPKDVSAHQERACAHFRLGHIAESVADFDRVVALAPKAAPHNWQRGIALYYAGRFADGAKQFELHRTVNPNDVENAAWHYLCIARDSAQGPAKAREVLIPIRGDPRVPLMTVHAMYAGKASEDDVLKAARAGGSRDALNEQLFYAHLYIGLFNEANGNPDLAEKHIALAAGTHFVEGYMGDVARVHLARMRARSTTRPATQRTK